MKLRAFYDLCRSEWNENRGDVRSLWLLESSYRELRDDALGQGAKGEMDIYLSEEDAREEVRAGFSVEVLINPCTRTVVKMHIARDMDVADVHFVDGHVETRFLDLAKAAELGFPVPA